MTNEERVRSLISDVYRIGNPSVGIDVSWVCRLALRLIAENEKLRAELKR